MERIATRLSKVVSRKTNLASKAITLEAANLAKFADGACTCSMGDTSVLVTVVTQQPSKPSNQSFVPLTVEYKQKAAAAGRIPMTHMRRDIGLTEREILTSRMIDRSIRPLFQEGFSNETQVVCNLLAVDGIHDADVLAINGASTSLALSDIPWNGPIGAVRMGLIGNELVPNPTRREQANSRLDLVMASNKMGNLIMMDGSCKEPILLPDILKTIKHGVKECQSVIDAIQQIQSSLGKPKKPVDLTATVSLSEEQQKQINLLAEGKIRAILSDYSHDKMSRDGAVKEVFEAVTIAMKESQPDLDNSILMKALQQLFKSTYRKLLTETRIRCDGRRLDEVRPITCKVNLYKPLHGSAIFQRGQTQVFCSTTFDSPDAAFKTDPMTVLMSGIKEKNFMLHYEFPPFATKEIGRTFAMPGRREIGHGALAEKSIRPVVPENNDMTIRLNCEVLESNGSSSMASVCAGSMSLMDASVNIKQHVAGVAMGLIADPGYGEKSQPDLDNNAVLLTDILGLEDYIGDMDFKIAGTRKAITALQLDVKPQKGVSTSIVHKALQQAHQARGHIINLMNQAISEPRKVKKDNHPVIKTIHVPVHKRAKFVGFGGANLKKLIAQIGVRISSYSPDDSISEYDYDHTLGATARDNFIIFAPNKDAMAEAEEFIKTLLEKEFKEPELDFNGVYTATIEELRPSGVMVSLYPNMTPALLPLSQLDIRTVRHPSALNLEVGQQIQVKYFGRDPTSGQMRLSRKSLQMSSVSRVHRANPIGQ